MTARLLLVVLALLAAPAAHAADQSRAYTVGPNTNREGTADDGTHWRSRSWRDGPNVYTDIQRRDGSKERCRSWQTGPNVYTSCD